MANRILGDKFLLCFCLMLVNLAKASEDTAQVMGSLPTIESNRSNGYVVSRIGPESSLLSPPLPPAKPTIYEDLFRYQLVTGSNVLPF